MTKPDMSQAVTLERVSSLKFIIAFLHLPATLASVSWCQPGKGYFGGFLRPLRHTGMLPSAFRRYVGKWSTVSNNKTAVSLKQQDEHSFICMQWIMGEFRLLERGEYSPVAISYQFIRSPLLSLSEIHCIYCAYEGMCKWYPFLL